jgi:hypothetical protein
VIILSTYTEPVLAELPEIQEPASGEHEDENPGAFAKLLAGLLNNTNIEVSEIETPEIQLIEISANDIEGLSFKDDAAALEKSFPSSNTEGKIQFNAVKKPDEIENAELNDDDFFAGHILLSADHLIIRQDDSVKIDSDIRDFPEKPHSIDEPLRDFSLLSDAAEFSEDSILSVNPAEIKDNRRLHTENNDRVLSKADDALQDNKSNEINSMQNIRPENEAKNRFEEARDKRRQSGKVTFEVNDMRTGNAEKNIETRINTGFDRVKTEAPVREITLELRLPEQAQNSAQTTWETRAGGANSALENMLARELHQNFNGDIVRHASMALRDGGEGTIRLTLKPESLGNVKIRLEMTENKITGQIIVESEEALRAFQKEIHSLEQAFRNSGFTDANLNLSLTADGRNMEQQEQEAARFSPLMVASQYENEQTEALSLDLFRQEHLSVNMFA